MGYINLFCITNFHLIVQDDCSFNNCANSVIFLSDLSFGKIFLLLYLLLFIQKHGLCLTQCPP